MITWGDPYAVSRIHDTMVPARIGDRKVVARLCLEAIEVEGLEKCMVLAEQKIFAAIKTGQIPNEIVVKSTDFESGPSPQAVF